MWEKGKEQLLKRKKWLWGILGLFSIFVLAIVLYFSIHKINEISREEAIKIVSSSTSNEVLSLNYEWDWQWEQPTSIEMLVKTSKGYEEIELDGNTGEVIERTLISDYQQRDLIPLEEAITLALNEVNGNVEEIELETDDNDVPIYDIEIKNSKGEYTVKIDAKLGTLLKVSLS